MTLSYIKMTRKERGIQKQGHTEFDIKNNFNNSEKERIKMCITHQQNQNNI